ncbi:Cardiolipin synthetase (Cardiolipin synthase) (CL synthase) [Candidatus Glomeribacter gigasporarum BEG34]|uniref:Cardiolipin synthase A n=1 Tax=Candidatus Glomeribacter gigasporarum BEG34 TaxID=1070319 RepID=G2J8T3_9BURK|nr:cardiolipin synthase [Candidatus Glomeribacter gigasporarum]CCD29180.1 Cardiolipin synthetase (Cardiolipin synthase) (CL synthase) [Candidatus Glomeribacter gigasporarum BEG34]
MPFNLLRLGTLIALAHTLGLIAAFHAIRTARTSQGAVAWAVSLITIPYLTLVPYLFLGSSRFAGYVDRRRFAQQKMHRHAWRRASHPPSGTARNPAATHSDALGESVSRALSALAEAPFTHGNQVRALINGKHTFAAIFEAIARATEYVIVQFFVVRDDALGRKLKEALIERAAKGVRVYFLYDGIGSYDLPRHYIEALRAGGVEAREFATRRFINRFQLNFRNHRKIVIVDGKAAFVGGHNIGDEYLGAKPPLSPWRDTHIEVKGPAVIDVQFAFIEDWYWAAQRLPQVRQMAPEPAQTGAGMRCLVMASGPADTQETYSLFFVQIIHAARRRLWIATPYFVPDEAVFAALRLAVMRGVEVRILLPARRDQYMVFQASTLYAHDAIRAGIQIFRYTPGFMHQKVALVDDHAAAIGSANLDNRSFRLNFELMVLTCDTAFAAEVAAMLETDFKRAIAVRLTEFSGAPAWRRAMMHVARLFSPIL